MHTFIINLERSIERMAHAATQVSRLTGEYERITAVDGQTLDLNSVAGLDQARARRVLGRKLNPGEIGCFLSHRQAAERIVALALPHAMVLEDDFVLEPGAPETLAELEKRLSAATITGWDVINLGNIPRKVFQPLLQGAGDFGAFTLMRAHYFPVLTTGLIWSQEGAQRFLQQSRSISLPVDRFLQRRMCESGRGLTFAPAPLGAIGAASLIEDGTRKPKTLAQWRHGWLARQKWRYKNGVLARKSRKHWRKEA